MSKIRVRDLVKFAPEKMSKVTVASTGRLQVDLYCLAPGQSQKAHAHADLDKLYYVLEGEGRFLLGGTRETLRAGEAMVAPAGVEHGIENAASDPLLALVVVVPPPTH